MSEKITIEIKRKDIFYIMCALEEAIEYKEDVFKLKTKKGKADYPTSYTFYKKYKKILKEYFKESI